jgi:hypothetical protein
MANVERPDLSQVLPSRRDFLKALIGATLMGTSLFAFEEIEKRINQTKSTKTPEWPTDQEGILRKIKELNFPKDSEIRTTLFFRKIMWENAQVQKQNGTWKGGDKSDWMNNLDTMKDNLQTLSKAGIKGGRLAIVPFELTDDGEKYNWQPLETALDLMIEANLVSDLCIGPIDYPSGIKVPKKFQDMASQVSHIDLDTSGEIHDYALNFLNQILEKYGKDKRIDKIYIGNEYPDNHGIEGTNTTMSVSENFMQEVIEIVMKLTDKKIVLNTNIHPSDLEKIKNTFGALFQKLGEQGILGIDAYPTQELKYPNLATKIPNYGNYIQKVREIFPNLIFTELQGEPWPPEGIAGKSWAEIEKNNANDVIIPYYQQIFPPTLESYVIKSGIKEVGIWGAPSWLTAKQLGYSFPMDMLTAISQTMNKNSS